KYNNANRFELSFTGGQSSARIYDSIAGTDTGTNFTTFKAGQTYTFTLISDNEYNFSTSGGASFNVRVLGGTAGNAVQSFSLFNRGYNNDDAIFGSIGVTDLASITYQANTTETKTVAGHITNNGASANNVLVPGVGTVIFS